MSTEFETHKKNALMAMLHETKNAADAHTLIEQLDEFDLYARDPHDFSYINEHVPNTFVLSAGGKWPFEAHGLLQGMWFYYRSENMGATYATLRVTANKDHLYDATYANYTAKLPTVGDNFHSFQQHFVKLVEMLEIAPFRYEFPTYRAEYDNGKFVRFTDEVSTDGGRFGWGRTAEEAYANLFSDAEKWSEMHHMTVPEYLNYMHQMIVSSVPVSSTERHIPERVFFVR